MVLEVKDPWLLSVIFFSEEQLLTKAVVTSGSILS